MHGTKKMREWWLLDARETQCFQLLSVFQPRWESMAVEGNDMEVPANRKSSVIPTWIPLCILRQLIYPDFFLISTATVGCCFSGLGLLSQVRSHKAKQKTREMMVQAFSRLSQLWKWSNHQVVRVFKFLVNKPYFGFVTAGPNRSNVAAREGGANVRNPHIDQL